MHILNKCRMYLNIITVADITNPYGTHIVNKPLHGTKHKLSHLQWPRSPSPTPNDWKIWKSSIQRFLMLHASNVQYPLGPRNSHYHHQFFPAPPIQHFDFTDMTPQRYLRVILTTLPPQYTQILEKISFPRDDGKAIANSMRSGLVLVGSDGSVKNNNATWLCHHAKVTT